MGVISTKPFHESHLDVFNVTASHKKECWLAAKQWDALGKMLQAGTHMIDGRILYISAYLVLLPGVLEVWMHPSIYVPHYKLAVVRHVKFWLEYIAEEHKARRLQTYGANTPESDRWLSFLGFEREGVLHSYLPDGKAVSIWGITCKT